MKKIKKLKIEEILLKDSPNIPEETKQMKQNSMEKRFDEKFVDTQSQPKLSDWTITTNHARYVWDIKAFIKQELEDIFSKLPSKDDPLSREEMLDIIEEQRRKVGLG